MQEGHAVASVDGNSRQLNRGYCHTWFNHSRKDGFYEEVVIWPYPALPEENGLVFRDVVAGLIIDKTSQPLTITQGIFRDGVNTLSFRSRRKDGHFLATLSISIYRNPGEPTNTFDANPRLFTIIRRCLPPTTDRHGPRSQHSRARRCVTWMHLL